MNVLPNTGDRRAADALRSALSDGKAGRRMDLLTPTVSLFAHADLAGCLASVDAGRLALSSSAVRGLLGGRYDRPAPESAGPPACSPPGSGIG